MFAITEVLFLSLLVVVLVRVFSLWFLSFAFSLRNRRLAVTTEKVSVIVPAFNEEKSIAQTLDSLMHQDYENYEVILVDDGSSDRTLTVAQTYVGSKLRVIHQDNLGKAEALNAGAKAATGGIILTVDADTRLNPGVLRTVAGRFALDKDLGALAGNVKVSDPKGILQRLQQVEYTASIGLARKGQSMLSSVMIVPGPVAAFRREVLAEAGYFSPQTFAEDFDITLAILKGGHKVEYEDRAIAYTIAPKGMEDLLKQRRRWYRGMMQVLGKYEGMFFRKRYGVPGMYGVPYMWYDTISPIVNLFLALFAVFAGLITGDWSTVLVGLGLYWTIQTLVAASAILLDRERHLWQLAVSPLLVFYNVFLDGIRTAAFTEEVLSLGMKWEKPSR